MSEEIRMLEFEVHQALLKLAGEVRTVNFSNPSGERAALAKRKQKSQMASGNATVMRRHELAERIAKKTGVPVSHVSAAKLSEDHMKFILDDGKPAGAAGMPFTRHRNGRGSLVEILGHHHSAKTLGTAAGIGAAYGALTSKKKKLTEKQRENAGPIARFTEKHPHAAGAAILAPTIAGLAHARSLPGTFAAAVTPTLAAHFADRGLKKLEDRKKSKQGSMDKVSGFSYEEKLAFARAVLAEGVVTVQMALDLAKHAEVSPEQARRSLDRLDTLERNKPDLKQVRRYATVGGLGGMGVKAIGNTIENYHPTKLPGLKGKLVGLGAAAVKGKDTGEKIRSLASMGVTGALGAGVIPLARSGTDRRAEVKTLRRYMRETNA
jgi:hypothetical protein